MASQWVTVRDAQEGDAALLRSWCAAGEMAIAGRRLVMPDVSDAQARWRGGLPDPRLLLLLISLDGAPAGVVLIAPHADPAARALGVAVLPDAARAETLPRMLRAACVQAAAHPGIKRLCVTLAVGDAVGETVFQAAGFRACGPGEMELALPVPIPHNRLTHGEPESLAVAETLASGRWAQGPRVAALENALCTAGGVAHAACVASGVSALRLALLALGVGPGARVIVPAYSCVALANAVLACGAEPALADVDPETWNISPETLHRAMQAGPVAAIIAVNTFGAPAPIRALRAVCDVPIVEDCAHAFGMIAENAPLGARGDAAVLSFYATKLMGAGEGGAVLTSRRAIAERVAQWRDYGDQPAQGGRLNDKMTDFEAALALCQLDRLPRMLAARQALAQRYAARLAPYAASAGFVLPAMEAPRVWYRYVVGLRRQDARRIIAAMHDAGVHAVHPVTDWRRPGDASCPNADAAYRSLISLPLYPTLTEPEQDRAAEAFLRACVQAAGS
ncbi:MAG TPA: DegT/DnrJ/EryC1/StrS aminotransferase family protein [Candidatus Hydrogenedentes bacterium]|nr:DegT/DnrJ/EryC1/StrS aminotransferase family protein [Candidatus Hydrogenedentota bacterium]HOS01846.1 DegT/DnrJ/EryC1/StrS aminotransferase family protein [Candidatus Hydrogenedentota bacterium]